MKDIDLLVTLWPSFPHFRRFACDPGIAGVRLNSAMIDPAELDRELAIVARTPAAAPVFYDVKGRQPRVVEVVPNKDRLELRLNHPIEVRTPSTVIFKGGSDHAVLDRLEEGGRRLVFRGGPRFKVKPGESLYLRDPELRIKGDLFTPQEVAKVEKVRAAGLRRYFLSYVEEQRDIDQFLELVGRDSEVWLKIESERGLRFVSGAFKKADNLVLVAARGDLFVELDRPHMMAQALELIISKDPLACAASRILLSVVDKATNTETLWRHVDAEGNAFFLPKRAEGPVVSPFTGQLVFTEPTKTYLNDASKIVCNPVPACADFLELEWMHSVGYRKFMLCDEMCLREDLLATAVGAFQAFRGV
jgi:pyruvate kinase